MRKYTVVLSCLCGCDDCDVFHVTQRTVTDAIARVRKKVVRDVAIVAVFEGHLVDKSTEEQRRAHLAAIA